MRQTLLSLFLFLAAYQFSFSQIDYMDYKERYRLSCGTPDSSEIVRNQLLVDSIFGLEIVNGEKEYLYDHGWVYYMRYLKWKDTDDLIISTSSFEEGWSKYHDLNALWNLGTSYRVLGDCDQALDVTELYLKEIPDSIKVDYKQIYLRYKFCRN